MVVFLGIQPGQVPEEPQLEGLDPFRDWQAACSALNRLICSVSGVRDPKDFPQTPGVEGIKALSCYTQDRCQVITMSKLFSIWCSGQLSLPSPQGR